MNIKSTILLVFALYGVSIHAQDQLGNTIILSDAQANFGNDVAVSEDGNYIITGANYVFDNTQPGFAQVFNLQNNNWVQVGGDLTGGNNGDTFGDAVAMNPTGNIVAVGGTQIADGDNTGSGYVRVYEFSSGQYVQMGSDIIGEALGDNFGDAISLSNDGTRLVVGARFNDSFTGISSANNGHVRVYEFDGTDWNQIGGDIDGNNPSDNFGDSVDISGDGSRIIAGASGFDGAGTNVGVARVYEYNGSNWLQIGQDILGLADFDFLGSVSMNDAGDRIAYKVGDSGVVLEYDGSQWVSIGNPILGFGDDVSVVDINNDGGLVAVGARSVNQNTGYVQLYSFNGSDWELVGNTIEGNAVDDNFGAAIDLKGEKLGVASTDFNVNTPNSGGVSAYDYSNNPLSVLDQSSVRVVIYPNPSSNLITAEGVEVSSLILFDINGRQIKSSSSKFMDVTELATGIYVLRVNAASGQFYTSRVIVE